MTKVNSTKKHLAVVYVLVLSFLAGFNLTGCSEEQIIPQSPSGKENTPKATTTYTVLLADFNSGKLVNNFGGEIGTWEMSPEDTEQGVKAALDMATKIGKEGASLRLEYDVDSPNNAVNGLWTQLGDFNASFYDHLEFWVRGDKKIGYPRTFKVEFKKTEKNPDDNTDKTIKGSYVVTGVTDNWQKISIPLNIMSGISDWHDIKEFIITFEKRRLGPNKTGVLYIDDIALVRTGEQYPKITDAVPHRKKKSDGELSDEEFAKFLIARLNSWPEKVFVKKKFPKDNREFLLELGRDLWRYFDEIVDREYQLPIDNIAFTDEGTVTAQTKVGDYTNITNVGLYLMCLVSAEKLGFITKEEAVKRINLTLDSIDKLAKYKNFPYNYYDITIFQETSNFISYVDCGWLACGIVVAKNAFPRELGKRCGKMLDSMDFSFFYDPVEGHMYHGYYTNIKNYSEYHYGTFYTEPRAISYLAIGKGDVSPEHWFMLTRTFPAEWFWQTQTPKERKTKYYMGYPCEGGYYEYDGIKFVPSWGGSMFEALMSTLIIMEKELGAKALGINDERHAKIQIKYALEKLQYPVFGLSPCSVPGDGYSEYGASPLGMKGYKAGVITPHATFLALEFAPEECIKNLREMAERYEAYGEYGFYDAIDPVTGEVSIKYLCLDQAMSFIALTNYLNDGVIRKIFHADPIAKNAESLLKIEDFFE